VIVQSVDFFQEYWVQQFLNSFEHTMDSVVITSTSPEEHFLYVNEAFKKKTGYTEKELLGKSPRILQGPKTDRKTLDTLKQNLKNGEDFFGTATNYRKDGTEYIVHWHITALKNQAAETIAYISYQKEITQEHFNESELKLLSSAIDRTNQLVSITDLNGKIVYVNSAFCKKYDYQKEYLIGKYIKIVKSGIHNDSFYKNLWETITAGNTYNGILTNKTKDGKLFTEQKTISQLKDKDGNINFYVSVGNDITEVLKKSDEYKELAYKDSLTQIANRLQLDTVIKRKLLFKKNGRDTFSIIMIDIDNFKYVNDTYGHDKGDLVLKNLSKIIAAELRHNDLFARWGGEEFVILIDDSMQNSQKIAQKVRIAIEKKLTVEVTNITISLGITQLQKDDTYDTLFKRVDSALYKSKQSGKNRVTVV